MAEPNFLSRGSRAAFSISSAPPPTWGISTVTRRCDMSRGDADIPGRAARGSTKRKATCGSAPPVLNQAVQGCRPAPMFATAAFAASVRLLDGPGRRESGAAGNVVDALRLPSDRAREADALPLHVPQHRPGHTRLSQPSTRRIDRRRASIAGHPIPLTASLA